MINILATLVLATVVQAGVWKPVAYPRNAQHPLVHAQYLVGNTVVGYYVQAVQAEKFEAHCTKGPMKIVNLEPDAKKYVEACPR